ncbi:MAG: PE-PPE domain-containing protein [Actinomycetia bacterium]|nr:PE-PPE domain-containing protein [Actinomycetes bacterium]
MSSSRYIGRVGALAFALGVGAAVVGGAGAAWADESSSDSISAHSSSGSSYVGDNGSSSQGSDRGSDVSTLGSDSDSDAATGTDIAEAAMAEADMAEAAIAEAEMAEADMAEADMAEAEMAEAAIAEVVVDDETDSAPPAEVVTLDAPPSVTTTSGTADPLNGGDPIAPVDVQLELALLGSARPDEAAAAAVIPGASISALDPGPVAAAEAVAQSTGLIFGGSGVPIPSEQYTQAAFEKYVRPLSPPGTVPERVFTPEGLYPLTGVKSLPLNISVEQGNEIMTDVIEQQAALGNTSTVFGYSQSSIMSSLVMSDLTVDPSSVQFVLVGNEMNPNGGLLSRFPDLNLPSLGIPFYGATPENPDYEVHNYTLEYDGFADFPQYPIHLLSVINAGLGIVFVHRNYLEQTQEAIDSAIELPSSSPNAHYYIIPTENLPLLEPVRLIPLIGDPIADLLQPILRPIVNLGYGDPNFGWSNEGDANVLQPFGFLPKIDLPELFGLVVDGFNQGLQDFGAAFSSGGVFWEELAALSAPSSGSGESPEASDNIIEILQTAILETFEFISNAAASLYSALLPTADIINAIVTILPAYVADLALSGFQQVLSGDIINGLINMVGLPAAAFTGLVTTSVLIEFLVIAQAIEGVFQPAP